ncbi:MAG: polysaccharide biosynthesis/export family protein [Chitinophagaceae bacterium]|nr:polysaccharide biosynthesis/export family protein [Chitinophagaceae bacterium]
MRPIFRLSLLLLVGIALFSCKSSKKLTQQAIYFREISDSMLQRAAAQYEPVLQKGDILSIVVVTPNEASAKLFNQPDAATESGITTQGGGATASSPSGYLVDENGNISIPYIGRVKAAGLKRSELTDVLEGKLKQFIDSASVTVRLSNYRITILGEVAKPGTYSIPSERVTIIDAIGLAGDLTIYGKRNNIRVIRQTDNVKQTGTLDINKGDIFNSPFYYLRQNDIVYVEMNNSKIINSDQSGLRTFGIVIGAVSALGVLVSTINILTN